MKSLIDQTDHDVLIKGGLDDRARQDFAFSLRNFVTQALMPANRVVFDRRVAPAAERATGRPPVEPGEIRDAMSRDSWYLFYLSARRTSQELIWRSVIPAVASATPAPATVSAGGTLTLDPDAPSAPYATAIDIHCMPGGYGHDRGDGDMAIGAVYDRGVYLYMSGLMGPLNDAVGRLAAKWLRAELPDFRPGTILDMGCGVGHATLPWAEAHPDAELTAIDIGPALLRYAHARAEALGRRVQFMQANAERTRFADASFDLIVSSIFLHETSTRALPAVLAECRRLLRPGGWMMHVDQPGFASLDGYQTFLQENETWYNNEPFWRQYRRIDLAALAVAAGFAEADVRIDTLVADVVRQSQNNQREADEVARRKGFSILLARAPQ